MFCRCAENLSREVFAFMSASMLPRYRPMYRVLPLSLFLSHFSWLTFCSLLCTSIKTTHCFGLPLFQTVYHRQRYIFIERTKLIRCCCHLTRRSLFLLSSFRLYACPSDNAAPGLSNFNSRNLHRIGTTNSIPIQRAEACKCIRLNLFRQ